MCSRLCTGLCVMYNILADRTYTSSDCATMSRAYEMAAAILHSAIRVSMILRTAWAGQS